MFCVLKFIFMMLIYKQNGFSFIELIIYLAIVCVMSNMFFISHKSLERQRIIQAANELKINIRLCQRLAMEEKRNYEILIITGRNLYYIRRANDNGMLIRLKEIYLPVGIDIVTNLKDSAIGYTQEGTTGDACTIVLRGKNYYLEITLNIGCGRVKISKLKKLDKIIIAINNKTKR